MWGRSDGAVRWGGWCTSERAGRVGRLARSKGSAVRQRVCRECSVWVLGLVDRLLRPGEELERAGVSPVSACNVVKGVKMKEQQ